MSVYRFVEAEKASFPITTMCRVLEVSASGYHAWRRRAPCARAVADAVLTEQIRAIWTRSRGTYGTPRVHAELWLDHGQRIGRKRVARLMRAAGLEGVHRRRAVRTTRRDRDAAPAPDLVQRQFRPSAPDRLWVADITYVPTWSGFLFLAVVVDAWSRRVIGWSMAGHLRTELVLDALDMALARRAPTAETVFHSDRGTQYTSLAFGDAAARPASPARWARSATPMTTRWPRASSPRSRPSSSTATAGARGPRHAWRCSTSSRPSTTRCAGTASSAS